MSEKKQLSPMSASDFESSKKNDEKSVLTDTKTVVIHHPRSHASSKCLWLIFITLVLVVLVVGFLLLYVYRTKIFTQKHKGKSAILSTGAEIQPLSFNAAKSKDLPMDVDSYQATTIVTRLFKPSKGNGSGFEPYEMITNKAALTAERLLRTYKLNLTDVKKIHVTGKDGLLPPEVTFSSGNDFDYQVNNGKIYFWSKSEYWKDNTAVVTTGPSVLTDTIFAWDSKTGKVSTLHEGLGSYWLNRQMRIFSDERGTLDRLVVSPDGKCIASRRTVPGNEPKWHLSKSCIRADLDAFKETLQREYKGDKSAMLNAWKKKEELSDSWYVTRFPQALFTPDSRYVVMNSTYLQSTNNFKETSAFSYQTMGRFAPHAVTDEFYFVYTSLDISFENELGIRVEKDKASIKCLPLGEMAAMSLEDAKNGKKQFRHIQLPEDLVELLEKLQFNVTRLHSNPDAKRLVCEFEPRKSQNVTLTVFFELDQEVKKLAAGQQTKAIIVGIHCSPFIKRTQLEEPLEIVYSVLPISKHFANHPIAYHVLTESSQLARIVLLSKQEASATSSQQVKDLSSFLYNFYANHKGVHFFSSGGDLQAINKPSSSNSNNSVTSLASPKAHLIDFDDKEAFSMKIALIDPTKPLFVIKSLTIIQADPDDVHPARVFRPDDWKRSPSIPDYSFLSGVDFITSITHSLPSIMQFLNTFKGPAICKSAYDEVLPAQESFSWSVGGKGKIFFWSKRPQKLPFEYYSFNYDTKGDNKYERHVLNHDGDNVQVDTTYVLVDLQVTPDEEAQFYRFGLSHQQGDMWDKDFLKSTFQDNWYCKTRTEDGKWVTLLIPADPSVTAHCINFDYEGQRKRVIVDGTKFMDMRNPTIFVENPHGPGHEKRMTSHVTCSDHIVYQETIINPFIHSDKVFMPPPNLAAIRPLTQSIKKNMPKDGFVYHIAEIDRFFPFKLKPNDHRHLNRSTITLACPNTELPLVLVVYNMYDFARSEKGNFSVYLVLKLYPTDKDVGNKETTATVRASVVGAFMETCLTSMDTMLPHSIYPRLYAQYSIQSDAVYTLDRISGKVVCIKVNLDFSPYSTQETDYLTMLHGAYTEYLQFIESTNLDQKIEAQDSATSPKYAPKMTKTRLNYPDLSKTRHFFPGGQRYSAVLAESLASEFPLTQFCYLPCPTVLFNTARGKIAHPKGPVILAVDQANFHFYTIQISLLEQIRERLSLFKDHHLIGANFRLANPLR